MVAGIITASSRWTVAQILTPILVAFFLCLAFILYFLYQRGSLSFLFMRGVRRVRRQREWEVDGDFPHAPNAEATPMISQRHHWNSFFPRNTTDRQRLSSRIREGMATPSITTAFRSIRRLFGRGPIPVSRVPVTEAFDLESSDSETDPFDTLRSNGSRTMLRPFKKDVAGSERGAYSPTHRSDGTRDSQALDAEHESDRALDLNGTDDQDNTEDSVMLITRNGEDFSSGTGSTSISLRSHPIEADQNSLEVTPPTPTVVSTSYNAMICITLVDHDDISLSAWALTMREVRPHLIFTPPPTLPYYIRSPLQPAICQTPDHLRPWLYNLLPGIVGVPLTRTTLVRTTTRRRHHLQNLYQPTRSSRSQYPLAHRPSSVGVMSIPLPSHHISKTTCRRSQDGHPQVPHTRCQIRCLRARSAHRTYET